MMNTFAIGVIGGGLNSAVGEVHRIASQMDGYFRPVCGCFSRHDEVNTATSERWGVSPDRVYSNYRDLIAQEKSSLDALLILTPTPFHKEVLDEALANGLAVISEKALVSSPEESEEIAGQVRQNQGFLAVTYNYTGYPMIRELREMIRNGDLGRIEQIHVEMPQEGFLKLDRDGNPMMPQAWRLHDGKLPVISLDLGVHLHQMIHFLTDQTPEEVCAHATTFGGFREIIDNVACMARYSGGLFCNFWFSKSALGYANGLRVRVFGDKGSAEWVQSEPEELVCADNKGTKSILNRASAEVNTAHQLKYNRFKVGHPSGFIEAFANHYADIAGALERFQNDEEAFSGECVYGATMAHDGLVFLEAVQKAADEKIWVQL